MPKPADGASQQPSVSFHRMNGHTSGKAQPRPEQQHQYQHQSQYEPYQQEQYQPHQQEQQAPPPKPMGVSDMYWASEDGQAEQTFTAGGYFFPGFATAYMFQQAEDVGAAAGNSNTGYSHPFDNGHGAFHPTGHTTTTTTTAAPAASEQQHHMPSSYGNPDGDTTQAQVWEVDSDEAEEIEEGHVNLLAGKGKARSRAGKKM
jgi:hypothetical protein